MRKYTKRIFLALALAGALAAAAQPLFATDKKIQQNEPPRIIISAPRAVIYPRLGDPDDPALLPYTGGVGAPPTPPPQNNDFAPEGSDGKTVQDSQK